MTKYLTRWRKKNGVQDLEKAKHFLDKFIEEEGATRELAGQVTQTFVDENSVERYERGVIVALVNYQLGDRSLLLEASKRLEGIINEAKEQGLHTTAV